MEGTFLGKDSYWWKWQVARVVLSVVMVAMAMAVVALAPLDEFPVMNFKKTGRQLEEFEYSNPNDTYSPNMFVKYGHELTGEEFEASRDYVERLLYAPIVTFGLGLLAFLGVFFGFVCRCCCECCRCLPDVKNDQFEWNRFYNTVAFFFLVFLVLVFDQLVFLGNESMDKGVNTVADSLWGVRNIFDSIDNDSVVLLNYGDDLSTAYTAAETSCPAVATQNFDDDIEAYEDAISTFQGAARDVVDALEHVHDGNDTYGIFYRNIGLYVLWGLSILCCILYSVGYFIQSVCFSQFAIFFGMTTYLLFIILGIVWLLLTSLFADICMDPSYNLVKSLPSGDLQDLANFYVSCIGNNTLQDSMNEGAQELAAVNSSINDALVACPGDVNLLSMRSTLALIDVQYGITVDNLDCPPLQTLWFQFINKGLCDETYTGLIYIWGSQLITSFFLLWLAVSASIVYQYYNGIRVSPSEVDSEEEVERDYPIQSAHDGYQPSHAVVDADGNGKVLGASDYA